MELQLELTSCQVETATDPMHTAAELGDELRRLRRIAAEAAEECGAVLLAVGLPPTAPDEFPITDTPRYRQIADRYGMVAHEQGICGCHVHVAVPDRDTAVRVCNRLRPWLPVLLALSANSAVYRNADTGYASWRSILWGRWPTAGPPPHLESAADYDEMVQRPAGHRARCSTTAWSIGTRDPRPNFRPWKCASRTSPPRRRRPCLLATLTRAAVMTALNEIRCGATEIRIPEPLLRARYWRAARDGLTGCTREALPSFVAAISPALHDARRIRLRHF